MDISNRRFCKRCRLKQCFAIGMKKEYILTEDEKVKKKQKIEENR
jgi:nuclear receptor subfamily 1 group I